MSAIIIANNGEASKITMRIALDTLVHCIQGAQQAIFSGKVRDSQMQNDLVNIQWDYTGKTDALLGNEATKAEQWLTWAGGLVAVLLYVYYYATGALPWSIWHYLVAIAIAADVGAGMVANSLNSCKRFYHTPAKADEPRYVRFLKDHFTFSALHIYPILIGLLYGSSHWFYGVFWYTFLMIGTVVILKMPLYLRRPASLLAILVALLLNVTVIQSVPGFAWFAPALCLKILYGHLVREEPYRP